MEFDKKNFYLYGFELIMKTNLLTIAILFAGIGLIVLPTIAQDCEPYIPMDEGVEFEMQSFNAKGKLESTSKQKVISRSVSGGDVEATIHNDVYDKKGELQSSSDYKIKCENGVFMVDMQMMIDPEQTQAYANMEVTVDGDFLEIPSSPTVGQSLKDANLNIEFSTSGTPIMTMRIKITNRKVGAKENITTPAGTFECYVISFDIETHLIFTIRASVKEWYSKGVGMVRSENYNKSGKLMGYSELSSIKK